MASERWVPTLGYELARIGNTYHVLKRGGTHVKSQIPDEEVSLRPLVAAADYDDAVVVLRALRATLPAVQSQPDHDEEDWQ